MTEPVVTATPADVLRANIAEAEALIANGGTAPPPKAEAPLTPEARIAAFDAEMREKGIGKTPDVADVPHDYKPDAPPVPPGPDASPVAQRNFLASEAERFERIHNGTERPRTQLELDIANRSRAAAGLEPIRCVPRKGADPAMYAGDLVAAGVLVPVLGPPKPDASAPDRELMTRYDAYIADPNHDREHAARFLAAVHDGLRKGEKEDDFRARMLKSGDAEKVARWSDAVPGVNGEPSRIEQWSKAAHERAAKLNDPRLVALVALASEHIEDGLRIAEFAGTRKNLDELLTAIEEGRATWTPELDKEVAAMRAAAHRRESREKLRSENAAELLAASKAPESAREAARQLAACIDTDGACEGERIPAELASGYDLSALAGHRVDVAGTLAELAEARAAGMSQEAVNRIIRQRFPGKAA